MRDMKTGSFIDFISALNDILRFFSAQNMFKGKIHLAPEAGPRSRSTKRYFSIFLENRVTQNMKTKERIFLFVSLEKWEMLFLKHFRATALRRTRIIGWSAPISRPCPSTRDRCRCVKDRVYVFGRNSFSALLTPTDNSDTVGRSVRLSRIDSSAFVRTVLFWGINSSIGVWD